MTNDDKSMPNGIEKIPQDMERLENGAIFILEASRTPDGIKISGSERGGDKEATIRRYETSRVSEKSIEENCAEVVEQLNRSIKRGKTSKEILNKLQALGQNLLDEILTPSLKERLAKTSAKYLLLKIDDALVHIPWEILYDGKSFLCQRFCMGRIVSTRQSVSPFPGRRIHPPLRMLIMADPGGDLQGAYHEGINIRDKLEKFSKRANVNLKQMDITTGFVREKIRQFDLVHFAGHGDYDASEPSNSGWLLKDGKFTAEDIGKMSGPTPFPALIFSNACHSGQTEEWKMDVKAGKRIFGLANAFLLAGVHHYIGTFWEIQDEPGTLFASKFYEDLLAGYSIGEAVKRAREHLISVYGEDGIVWAGYVLYGDPTTNYLAFADEIEKEAEEDVPEPVAAPAGVVRSPDYSQDAASRTGDGPAARRFRSALGFMLALACLAAFWVLNDIRERDALRSVETAKALQKSHELLLDRERPREEELQGERLKQMIADLAKKYREEKEKAPLIPEDQWTSRPLVLSFLPLNYMGTDGLAGAPLNIDGLLARRARIKVVERTLIDKLISELNLSSSDLADPATALKLGRILGARFIGAGSFSFFKGEYRLDLRVLETETTALVAAASSMATGDGGLLKMAEEAASKLSDALLAQYPLRGKISSVEGGRVILNIGGKTGVTPGMKFTVYKDGQPVEVNGKIVDYRKEPVGEMDVEKVEAEYSEALAASQTVGANDYSPVLKDMRVEEKH